MTQDVETEPGCPVCHAVDSYQLAAPPKDYEYQVAIAEKFGIRVCNACRSEFVSPRPSLDELRQMYPDNYYAYGKEMGGFWQKIYDMWCRSEAKRLLSLSAKRPLHLFDVGAGDCRRFKAMASAGDFKFSGVEMNPEMAQAGCDAGFDISPGAFEEFEPSGRTGTIDVLTINHVIEHVTDPYDTVRKAHSLLAEDGIFTGRTPKLACTGHRYFGRYWGGYHFPRHLQLFSRESLELLLHRCGFREVKIIEELNLFPALSLQNALLGKLGVPLKLEAGHSRFWTLLVFLTAPLSILDYLFRRSDCMIFSARK
ncbi:MAG: class I SAM-dependent methyltransferase [Halioglobus sp.]|nr:class I SAM-dependent methyltransferase [Halioglobus sp.]